MRMLRMDVIRKKQKGTTSNDTGSVFEITQNSLVCEGTTIFDISNVNHNVTPGSVHFPTIRSPIIHEPSIPGILIDKDNYVQLHNPSLNNHSDFNRVEQALHMRMLRMAAIREKRNRPPSQTSEYCDEDDPVWQCQHCGALMWYAERVNKLADSEVPTPKFSLCCMQGKVELPLLQDAPPLLTNILTNKHPKSKHFCENIIAYNMIFSFTSLGGKISSIIGGRGPYCYRMNGQNFHRIGSLLPIPGSPPKFSQLYIYDTEHEDSNRIQAISSKEKKVQDALVSDLRKMIDEHNPHAKAFRIARDRFKDDESTTVTLRRISKRTTDGRTHNLPTASEVAALIVGDVGTNVAYRDIILQTRSGILQRIHELHPSYLALQYPLIFPYGEDGYRPDISLSDRVNNSTRKRSRVTIKEFVQ